MPPKELWPILAALRFLFASWVLFDHTYNFGPASRAMPVFSLSGLMPVLCFLAIFGFSIRHSLTTQPSGYFRRRFWRIAPTNIACVGVALVAFLIIGSPLTGGHGDTYPMPSHLTWIVYAVGAQAIFPVFTNVLFPSWSLSIEIAYYAFAPMLQRMAQLGILLVVILSAALFAIWPILAVHSPSAVIPQYIAQATFGFGIVAFAWAWLAGWIAYGGRNSHKILLLFVVLGCVCTAAQPYAFALDNPKANIATYMTWIITSAILFVQPRIDLPDPARDFLEYLGDISFPLYLVHYPLVFVMTSTVWKRHPGWNYGIFQVILAFAAAALIYRFIDKPLRALGRVKAFTMAGASGIPIAPSSSPDISGDRSATSSTRP